MFGYICAATGFTVNAIIGIAMIAVAALAIVLMSVLMRSQSDDEAPDAVEETSATKEEPAVEKSSQEEANERADDAVEEPVEEVAEQPQEEVADEPAEKTAEEVVEEAVAEEAETSEESDSIKDDASDDTVATVTPAAEKAEVAAKPAVVAQESAFPKIVAKKRSFAEKVRDLPDESKENYNMIKTQLMSYDGVKNRTTKSNDVFRHKRAYIAKISVLGKTVKLHLALNPEDYAAGKYHHKDLSAKKKYAKVPFMLKIKSQRSKKYAVELIGDAMRKAGLEKGSESKTDYIAELVATIPAE